MKYVLPALAFSASLLALTVEPASAAVNPDNNWYAGASGDFTWPNHADMGGGANIALGYKFSNFRIEGEGGYHGADGDVGYPNVHYFTYMGNAYYDFNNMMSGSSANWHIVPYIGGGAGGAAIRYGSSSFTNTFHHHDNVFAYQGMTGLTFKSPSMPATDFNVGYRYFSADNNDLHSNNLDLGVKFHF